MFMISYPHIKCIISMTLSVIHTRALQHEQERKEIWLRGREIENTMTTWGSLMAKMISMSHFSDDAECSYHFRVEKANTRLISNRIYCFDFQMDLTLPLAAFDSNNSNTKASSFFSRFQFKCLREWFGLRVGDSEMNVNGTRSKLRMVLKVSIFHYMLHNMFSADSINLLAGIWVWNSNLPSQITILLTQ